MRRVLLPHHISPAPPPAGAIVDLNGFSMGTTWSVRLVAPPAGAPSAEALQRGLQQQLDAVVAEMSHWEADSDLGRFNRAPADSWQALPDAFFTVLDYALGVAEASDGAYDPCAGALVNLWGFGAERRYDQAGFVAPTLPQAALASPRRPELDRAGRRARQPGGTLLDLSAVAKGYGVDQLARYLASRDIHHYLVEVGGELRGAGVKPDGQPWWVALEQPGAGHTQPDELVLALHGLAVATSGDYRRYFEQDQRRYAHTIDPRSGAPVDNGLASVTVVHAQCMAADAWLTALTVLGVEAGVALADRLGLAARFVLRGPDGLSERMSAHFSAMLQ